VIIIKHDSNHYLKITVFEALRVVTNGTFLRMVLNRLEGKAEREQGDMPSLK
jgi:hypothetical protein